MTERNLNKRFDSGIPARIKLVSFEPILQLPFPRRLVETVRGLYLALTSEVCYSNAKRRRAALQSSEAEKRRLAIRYLRQPPLVR